MVNPVRVQVSVAAPQSQQRRFSRVPAPLRCGHFAFTPCCDFSAKEKMQDIRAAPRFFALLQNYRAAHSFFFRGEAARAAERIGVFSVTDFSHKKFCHFASACTVKVRALCIYALLRLFRKRKMQGIRAAPRFFALLQNYRAAHSFFFRGEAARAARMIMVFF